MISLNDSSLLYSLFLFGVIPLTLFDIAVLDVAIFDWSLFCDITLCLKLFGGGKSSPSDSSILVGIICFLIGWKEGYAVLKDGMIRASVRVAALWWLTGVPKAFVPRLKFLFKNLSLDGADRSIYILGKSSSSILSTYTKSSSLQPELWKEVSFSTPFL